MKESFLKLLFENLDLFRLSVVKLNLHQLPVLRHYYFRRYQHHQYPNLQAGVFVWDYQTGNYVSINGERAIELMTRERDMRKAVGPKFELRAEVFDENGDIVNTITRTIEPGCSKDIMINLPALSGGAEEFIVPAPR